MIFVVLILIGGFAGYRYLNAGSEPPYEFATARRGEFIQEISATGKVSPATQINLYFKNPGKLAIFNVQIGKSVKKGEILAEQDMGMPDARLKETQAGIDMAKAKLDKLIAGATAEEIRLAETAVANAEATVVSSQKALSDAEKNLANVKLKAGVDLSQAYDGAVNASAKSVSAATSSLYILTDIQLAHFNDYGDDSSKIAEAKGAAILALLGGQNAGRMTNTSIVELSNGAKAAVGAAQLSPTAENISAALSQTKDSLQKVKSALDAVPLASSVTETEKTNLSAEKASINAEIIAIASKEQAIAVQKAGNESLISAAERDVNLSQSALRTAEGASRAAKDQLALKQASAASADIALAKAQIRQAEASAQMIREQIKEMILVSPADGVITDTNGDVGENISPSELAVSIMPLGNLEVDVDASESGIVSVKVGQEVKITLDAFPAGMSWTGRVVRIDPAQTVIGGAVYYKTKVLFDEQDDRIKPGMTANIWIKAAEKENVIFLPAIAVKEKNGKKYVEVLEGKQVKRKEISAGLKGAGGMIEIISGIGEGENVIVKKK